MVHAPYVWIDSERDLVRAAEPLSRATSLAVDTEAESDRLISIEALID